MSTLRVNRGESQHPKRRTLEDEHAAGKVNMIGTPDPNKYYHVVVDKNGKVDRMKQRGYVVEDGSNVSLGDANPKEVGTIAQATANPSDGSKAILMSCPREFKEEDDAYRQSQVDKTEEALYRNQEKEADYGKIKKE